MFFFLNIFSSNEDFLCDSLDGPNNNLKKRKLTENHKNVVNNNLLNGMMNLKQETGKFPELERKLTWNLYIDYGNALH